MIFKDAWVLLLIPFTFLFIYLLKRKDTSSTMRFSSGELVKGAGPTWRILLAGKLPFLRAAVIVFFLLALARPRIPLEEAKVRTEGIDIVLAVDCSTSMLAEDFKAGGKRRNRLYVAKDVIEDFIHMRKSDRIGLIAFAGRAYTVCPLTLDYDWLSKNLERVEIGSIEDGTAIGSAINSSLNRIKDNEAKSKIVILLTDGINNKGKISPLTAAEAAKALGVKVYTIGAGSKGVVPYPVRGPWGGTHYQNIKIEIDEDMLKEIARITGGKYFRAMDTKSLENIYREIDLLEKTPIEETGFREYKELFTAFLVAGFILFMLEIILSNTILRKLP